MNLPSELFSEITSSVNVLGRDEPLPGRADRRSPRVKLSSHLSLSMWCDPSFPLSVRIRDLSAGGIGLFHSQRIALDEKVVVRFPLANDRTALVLGTVVYWEPLADKLFAVGVQFDRMIEASEIAEQSDQTVRQHNNQLGIVSRLTMALARTWRIAS